MKKIILLSLVVLLGLCGTGIAGTAIKPPIEPTEVVRPPDVVIFPPMPPRPRPPIRIVVPEPNLKPVEISTVEIDSEIIGRISNTVIEIGFTNPNSRILEGELQFPLADGQTITGFALEFDTVNENRKKVTFMRNAVPVEKQKGQEVFEEIVRRNVDPALLEQTVGNNFKLRIYPLNPGVERRVRLVITETLPADNENLIYRLPVKFEQKIGSFSLTIKIASEVKPLIKESFIKSFNTENKNGSWTFSATEKDTNVDGEFEFNIPIKQNNEPKIFVGNINNVNRFYAEIPLKKKDYLNNVKKIDLFWDASMSGKNRNITKELDFLDAFFNKVQNVEVNLTFIRNVAESAGKFEITKGHWKDLRATLANVIYDGATNLHSVMDAITRSSDIKMLFSDGIDNFSTKELPQHSMFYVVNSVSGANVSKLKNLSKKGAFIDLTVYDAATALDNLSYRVDDISFEGQPTAAWEVSGNMLKVGGLLKNNSKNVVEITVNGEKFVLNYNFNSEYRFVPLIVAQMQIMELEADYEINKAEIRRIGQLHGIVTRGTSLIVLERPEDYVMYDIDPPAELKKECDRLRANGVGNRNNLGSNKNRIEEVVMEWKEREHWYNRKFDKSDLTKFKMRDEKGNNMESPLMEMASDILSGGQRHYAASAPGMTDNLFSSNTREAAQRTRGDSMSKKMEADSIGSANSSNTSKITIRQWTSDAPYVARMKETSSVEQMYKIYLDERPDYENSPAFFVDVAYQFELKGNEELSLRVLSNLAEINLENRQILRILGNKLMQLDKAEFAVVIFRKVIEIGAEEPQSYRDLGLAYEANKEYQKAVDSLWTVVEKGFKRRFPGIEVIALTDMNKIIATSPVEINTKHIDNRLLKNLPLDLRVILVWDADVTDMDLHVIDPNKEDAHYAYPLSYQGGRMSPDNTTGYGPEEFSLKDAKPGKYTVKVTFYGHRQQSISEATTVQLDFFTKYGTEQQKKESVTLRLKDRKENIFVGEFEVE